METITVLYDVKMDMLGLVKSFGRDNDPQIAAMISLLTMGKEEEKKSKKMKQTSRWYHSILRRQENINIEETKVERRRRYGGFREMWYEYDVTIDTTGINPYDSDCENEDDDTKNKKTKVIKMAQLIKVFCNYWLDEEMPDTDFKMFHSVERYARFEDMFEEDFTLVGRDELMSVTEMKYQEETVKSELIVRDAEIFLDGLNQGFDMKWYSC